ncbi:MAG: efflux RND transporter periplasmic adaptor subunit [Terracidiphilus sp.]|nr:efflux RND transporter periplasmic adaptor subunit [Terracidiphilus sp.]MDR3776204.1 efflux RND transporter periplasmic adaptor subunit [Terracidiphilus sp.]
MASLFAVLALSAEMLSGCGHKAQAVTTSNPVQVQVVQAEQRDVPIYGDWIATLDGYVNAQIQPQVTGYLVKQLYREGSYVRKDQVLFQIDPQTFQASLDVARAQLAQAAAKLELADINVKRDTPLAQQHAISQSQLDSEMADQRASKAAVQASVAAVAQAQINLNFTHVRSLTDGIAGIAATQMGNLVAPGTVLTSVSKVDPIKVYFSISEQEYMRFSRGPQKGSAGGTQNSTNALELQLELSDGTKYPHKGKVVFVDRQVDTQTGTIRLVAAFPNPGNILRPGQFGRIHAATAVNRSAILVPQRCVSELQGTNQVAVVDANRKVSIRSVKVGSRVGSMWIVESGVNVGEEVISEGSDKVHDGTIVNPTMAKMSAEGNE